MHQAKQACQQRRQQLTELMQAEGLALAEWEHRVSGMAGFLNHAEGSAEELVAQAKAFSQAHAPGLQGYAV